MSSNTGIYSSNNLMEEIKSIMRFQKISQETLGKELGYSRKAINRQLQDPCKRDWELILKICKRLGIKAIIID